MSPIKSKRSRLPDLTDNEIDIVTSQRQFRLDYMDGIRLENDSPIKLDSREGGTKEQEE